MKTLSISKIATVTGLTLALTLGANFTASAQAPEKGSAKGGASLLMKPIPAVSTAEYTPMSCAKCKDVAIAVRDTDTRGLGARTQLALAPRVVAKHLCEACGTDWAITGHGKARTMVATHTCAGAADLACCDTVKGSGKSSAPVKK